MRSSSICINALAAATLLSNAVSAFAPVKVTPSLVTQDTARFSSYLDSLASSPTTDTSSPSSSNVQKEDSSTSTEFINDGQFQWMVPQLEKMGYTPGKTTFYGAPIAVDSELLDDSTTTSNTPKPLYVDKSTPSLTNIGPSERQRRANAAQIFLYMTLSYFIVSSLFWDDGSVLGHVARFGIYLPLSLFLGYRTSAQYGLCNIAQVGLMDEEVVASSSCKTGGLVKIEDVTLAKNLMERVNSMNFEIGLDAIALAIGIAALPHDVASKMAVFTLIGWPLYAWNKRAEQLKME